MEAVESGGGRRGSPRRSPGRVTSALTPGSPPGPASRGTPLCWRSLSPSRVASSPQAEPQTPQRSHHGQRLCGVGGLCQDPRRAVSRGHCRGLAGGRRPETDLHRGGGSALLGVHFLPSRGSRAVHTPPTWSWVAPGPVGCAWREAPLGALGPRRRLLIWVLPSLNLQSHLLFSFLLHDGDSEASFPLLCQSWSEGERRARSEGQH